MLEEVVVAVVLVAAVVVVLDDVGLAQEFADLDPLLPNLF